MTAVWAAENRNTTDPALAGDYAAEAADVDPYHAARRPAPGKPESEWSDDERVAERSAATDMPHHAELTRRLEGERLRTEGALPEAEEDHGVDAAVAGARALARTARELPDRVRALAAEIEDLAPAAARRLRRAAEAIPAGVEDLAKRIEAARRRGRAGGAGQGRPGARRGQEGPGGRGAGRVAGRGRGRRPGRSRPRHGRRVAALGGDGLRAVPYRAGRSDRSGGRVPGPARPGAAEPRAARDGREPGPGGDPRVDPAFAAGHTGPTAGETRMSPAREALFAEARELFKHPYDTTWWEAPVLEWSVANQARLEAYIRARNAGVMHHHPGH